MKTKLAILGCGNMGSAIALGVAKKTRAFHFFAYTPTYTRARKLARTIHGKAVKSLESLKDCDYFLIACKPQQFSELAPELKKILNENSKIVSIMAGVPTRRIKRELGVSKVARVMPNTPCLIGEGCAALYFSGMTRVERRIVKKIFSPVAKLHVVTSDDKIDAATTIIGSGPAYIFEIARLLAEKFATLGFPKYKAQAIVKDVFKGSSILMAQSRESLEELQERVISWRGTTWAALQLMKKRHLSKTISAALTAAYKRAKQLSH